MFKATLSDVRLLKNCLEGVVELVNETTIDAKKDGISIVAADPTMVTLVDLKILSTVFDEYNVSTEQKISINLDNLLSILKRAKAEDHVSLEVEKGASKLVVTLKGSSVRNFSIPLLDLDEVELPEMNLNFAGELEIKSGILEDGIGDASVATDTVMFGATPDAFTMLAKGDTSQVDLKLEKGSEGLIGLKVGEAIKSKYSLDYLKKIVKVAGLSDVVKIQFGNDFPLKLTFRQVDKMQISYVLAPRVED